MTSRLATLWLTALHALAMYSLTLAVLAVLTLVGTAGLVAFMEWEAKKHEQETAD